MSIIMQLWTSAQDDPSKQAVVATFKKLVDVREPTISLGVKV